MKQLLFLFLEGHDTTSHYASKNFSIPIATINISIARMRVWILSTNATGIEHAYH